MSRIPDASPISNDIEHIRRAGEDEVFGGNPNGAPEPRPEAEETGDRDERDENGSEDHDELDALAAASVEGRRPAGDAEPRRTMRLA